VHDHFAAFLETAQRIVAGRCAAVYRRPFIQVKQVSGLIVYLPAGTVA
jgi:hypothetical protein